MSVFFAENKFGYFFLIFIISSSVVSGIRSGNLCDLVRILSIKMKLLKNNRHSLFIFSDFIR